MAQRDLYPLDMRGAKRVRVSVVPLTVTCAIWFAVPAHAVQSPAPQRTQESGVVAAGTASATNQVPVVLPGEQLCGVRAAFCLTEFSETNGILKGHVVLRNASKEPVGFTFDGDFKMHLRLQTQDQRFLIPGFFSTGDGISGGVHTESGVKEVLVPGNSHYTNYFAIDLGQDYDLKRNDSFRLQFVYDVRLCLGYYQRDPVVSWAALSPFFRYRGPARDRGKYFSK